VTDAIAGRRAWASLRPEAIRLVARGHSARVVATAFLGTATRLHLEMAGRDLTALVPRGAEVPRPGQTVEIGWGEGDLHLMEGP
jgi:putative spermidine/putrescine transport system ATP-binding protein